MPRKIIVHLATSADGYIARPDGGIDFLTEREDLPGFYGMPEFMRSVDGKILGRKTYDKAIELGQEFRKDDLHYVFSRSAPPAEAPPGVEFVREPIRDFAKRMRAQPGRDLWHMGGGDLIGSFLDADAIDEVVVTMIPVFIGDGIPLLSGKHRTVHLRLLRSREFEDGVVQLHYAVDRERQAGPRKGKA